MKLSILASAAFAAAQHQFPLGETSKFSANDLEALSSLDAGLRAEIENLIAEKPVEFFNSMNRKPKDPLKFKRRDDFEVVATSPEFPNHQIRARSPKKLGVDKVKQWSGYVDVLDEDKHFFFWFFESRSDPVNDPTVMWLNGGPGCSSSTGLFFELGPSTLDENLTLHYNPYSWNNHANLLFLDQPVNVGFSYSSEQVDTSTLAGVDVYAFLSLFFEQFPEYATGDFHIAGESYGGHYLPAIGYEIIQHEDRNFNFTSLLIGNGITDSFNQEEAQIGMACGMGGYPTVIEPETCEKLYKQLPRCQQALSACYDTQSPLVCSSSGFFCSGLSSPYYETGRNAYDIRDVCGDSCYPEIGYIDQYLNQEHVQKELGVEAIDFVGCSSSVGVKFGLKGDGALPFQGQVAAILEYGVPILIYAGDKDYICNWLGNRAWTDKLPWSHHDEYASAEYHKWYVSGKAAGETKNAGELTFLRIYDAGHMVPHNKPREALVMLKQWLKGNYKLKN